VEGVVIRLARGFNEVTVEDDCVKTGTAVPDVKVSRAAADAGLSGLEFLRGVPGTIGGALRMNAGCYGCELKDILVEAKALDRKGRLVTLAPADMAFTYRNSGVSDDLIFIEAVLAGAPDDAAAVHTRMDALVAEREASQPVRAKTGGSTFKNPPGHKAWQLIDEAGCRGLRIGGAQMSEKHCNFLINTGDASAADIERLGEEVRARVRQSSGIDLQWEIRRVGVPEGAE
jgi:UDP-N-acetylmuramate dehydrogenase